MAVKRGGWFVKNHQMKGRLGDCESARDFDHLTFTNRQVADHRVESNAMTRKNLVEFPADQSAGALPPAPAGDGRMKDAGVFSHRQIRAKRQFLKDTPDPQLLGEKR